jgi:hypothetical protein
MKKQHIKKIEVIENERLPIFEHLISTSKILNQEEKENLLFSIKYIIHIIIKYKNINGSDI